jgi:hypothetical protein
MQVWIFVLDRRLKDGGSQDWLPHENRRGARRN